MADIQVDTIHTTTTHGAMESGSTTHGAVTNIETSGPVNTSSTQSRGARTDQAAMHRGVAVTVKLAIYQPRLGGGPAFSCPT